MKRLFFITFFIIFSLFCSQESWQEAFEKDLFELQDSYAIDVEDCLTEPLTRAVISQDAAVINLTDPLGLIKAQNVLKNPLYYYSFPPIRRSVIDEPMFQQFTDRAQKKTKLQFLPFFEQTFKEYFYGTKESINSYIDMIQQPLNDQVSDLITEIDIDDFLPRGFTVTNFLDLFSTIFLEQRQTGLMFEYEKNTRHWSLSFRIPFYYLEHNLNMPEKDRERVQNDPFFSSSGNDEMEFARAHLISDRLGFGDTRINFEHVFVNKRMQVFSAGVRFTIPTAFSVKKGLYGTHFNVFQKDPKFDLYTDLLLPGLSTPPDQNIPLVQSNVNDFGYAVLDRLSTILLEAPTGNRGHFGIGIFSHNKMIFSPKWSLTGLTSAEILLPAHEQRFYILQAPNSAFNAFDWNDVSPATGKLQEKLAFLNAQFIQKFFPQRFTTLVFPGLIIQSTSALTYAGEIATITGGSDLWWKTKESLSHIEAPEATKPLMNLKTAKGRFAFQSKLWCSLEKSSVRHPSFRCGLRAQVSVNSFGVGDDWGFSFLLQKDF